ncbi:MAG: MBL fold metallo-hydrolase [Ilumatobacteraceae bacterium]
MSDGSDRARARRAFVDAWQHEIVRRRPPRRTDADDRLGLLGTSGGSNPKATRCGYANAVVVGDAAYLVDAGEGAHRQMWRAGITANPRFGPGRPLVGVVCITHLHADHIMDLANLFQGSWPTTPVDVYGPGPAGPPFTGHLDTGHLDTGHLDTGRADPVHPVRFPETPAPGTRAVLQLLDRAFATNINARIIAEGRADYVDLVRVHEIGPADEQVHPDDVRILTSGPSAFRNRSDPGYVVPDMEPFQVRAEDDHGVTITATLVDHAPMFPALAYRFDTPTGSVVFSGDTGPCDNVVRLARGADLLVHEVFDLGYWVDKMPASMPNRDRVIAQLARSHTPVEAVADIAERAGVDTLVLSHLVPGDGGHTEVEWETMAQPGFSGRVVCGVDLDEFAIG